MITSSNTIDPLSRKALHASCWVSVASAAGFWMVLCMGLASDHFRIESMRGWVGDVLGDIFWVCGWLSLFSIPVAFVALVMLGSLRRFYDWAGALLSLPAAASCVGGVVLLLEIAFG